MISEYPTMCPAPNVSNFELCSRQMLGGGAGSCRVPWTSAQQHLPAYSCSSQTHSLCASDIGKLSSLVFCADSSTYLYLVRRRLVFFGAGIFLSC